MSIVPKETIEVIAQSIGVSNLVPDVLPALASDVEYRVREIMQVQILSVYIIHQKTFVTIQLVQLFGKFLTFSLSAENFCYNSTFSIVPKAFSFFPIKNARVISGRSHWMHLNLCANQILPEAIVLGVVVQRCACSIPLYFAFTILFKDLIFLREGCT